MCRRIISSIFSWFTRSSAPLHETPPPPVRETLHASDDIETSHASDNMQSLCSHLTAPLKTSHSQSIPPLGVPSTSQLHVSEDVRAHTPSIATSAVPSSSTPSSSVLKEQYYTGRIRGDADAAVDPQNEEAYLDALSEDISQYLAFIKGGEKPSMVSAATRYWPGENSTNKLKEVITGAGESVKALAPDAKTIAQKFLQGMGGVHILMTGFLVVGAIMERFGEIQSNKEECLCLFERMNNLIQHVKELRKREKLKEAMDAEIKEAINLIIEVSLACCTQIDMPTYQKFLKTEVNTKKLRVFQTLLTELHQKIQLQMEIALHDHQIRVPVCPGRSEKFRTENKDQIKKVTELLKWKTKESAVAVILYGLGGTGKTALADAVYWSLYHEKVLRNMEHEEVLKYKYSYVRLFDPMIPVPDINMLQTQILQDLTLQIPDIRSYELGQVAILEVLEKETVFIYIDNVSFPDTVKQCRDAIGIEELLPRITTEVKQLRLLITTRDKGAAVEACNRLGIKTELYPIETLEDAKARQLLEEELNRGEEDLVNGQLNGRDKKLDSNQINQIVQICGGIPMLLIKVAKHIGCPRNREKAQGRYKEVISKKKNNWKGRKGWTIASYAFAHKHLDEELKDPFFDICSYFEGWHWEELSNIVGEVQLHRLEDRALVTKDVKSMTAKLHIVILAIGVQNKGERFKFTCASDFNKFLEKEEDEYLRGIKGIWLIDKIGSLDIPASKLNLMCGSLRVLALESSTMVNGQCNQTFKELFFFSADISHIPFDLSKVKKLRHLCYRPDDLQNLCQMPSNRISKLRIRQLRLCGSIESLPESIGQFNCLDSIDLSSTDLKKLPDGFCSLSLKKLVMDNCWSLEELPHRFGDLRSLRKLRLWGCVSLKKLPKTFSQLELLEDLNLSCCVTLKELCAGFNSLSSLRILLLGTCRMLEKLPQDFHCLPSLEHLCLSDCDKLEGKTMESIVKMETLQTVDIQRSPLLREAWQKIKEGCNFQGFI